MFGLFNFRKKSTTNNSSLDIATLENFSNLLRISNDYNTLAKTAYTENVIVNTCIHRTADSINDIPKEFYLNDQKVDASTSNSLVRSIIKSIETPSADCSNNLFLESVVSSYMIGGEAYVFPAEDAAGRLGNLEYLRPSKISKTTSSDERVHQYMYNSGSKSYVFNRDKYSISDYNQNMTFPNPDTLQGCFNLIVFKSFNPQSEVNGLSKLSAAGLSVDGHNDALEWNNSIMKNSGKPSAIVSFGGPDGTMLSTEQIDALERKLSNKSTGKNRGSVLVSNSLAKYDKLSMTSQEMDFIQGIVQRAIDICNALDFPPYLLGFTGATFSNQDSAKLSLYENSAIPKFDLFWGGISSFLSKKYDIDFKIKPNLSEVVAMMPRFIQKNDNVIKQWQSNLIDQNEAREKLGYKPKTGGDNLYYGDFRSMNINNNIDPT